MKFLKDLIMHLRIRKIQKNLPQTSENAIKSKKIDKNPLTVQGKISHCWRVLKDIDVNQNEADANNVI